LENYKMLLFSSIPSWYSLLLLWR